jgi:HK97 family phage major capsid protein
MAFYDLTTGKSISRVEILREQGEAAIKAAREIEETAQNRAFTADEQSAYDAHVAEAKQCVEAMKTARTDEAFIAGVGQLFDGTGLEGGGTPGPKGKRLSFAGMGEALARQIMPDGSKALAPSGSAVVPQALQGDVVALGQPAMALTDVIPVEQFATPELAYLRQVTRTQAAQVVSAGAQKPTSIYTVNKITA